MADVMTGQLPPATVGSDYSANIALQQGGVTINLSSIVQAELVVSTGPGAPALLTASLANGQLTINASAGTATVVFPNGQLAGIVAATYQWELKLQDNSSTPIISKPVGGPFAVNYTIAT